MSTCAQCGLERPAGARFCPGCGTPFEEPAGREARKVVTVLFCDLASSTALAERLDPEVLRRVLERYFACARETLGRHGGTIEKFIGDAVMGVFGIPTLHEDDALRAVRAASELIDAVDRLNEDLAKLGVELVVRVGVNTGEVIAGERADEALVTGDAVVTAKRLEEAAPGGGILMGPRTYALVCDAVDVEPVDSVTLKGKSEPVRAYLLRGVRKDAEGRARRLDSPLVGRETELVTLREAFADAVSTRTCRLVTVLGPAGIGKTRLSRELSAAFPDARVLRGRCLPYGDGIAYWPLLEIVRGAAGLTGEEPPAETKANIAGLLDGTGGHDRATRGVAAALGLGEEVPVEELFWAARTLLESLGSDQPLLVVLDDLQWASSAFLDLVEYLASRTSGVAILLCCLARPDLLDVRPLWTAPRPGAGVIVLHALGSADSERLVGNLLRGELPESLRGRVLRAAEGNPLFVEELLRMLIDDGVLRRTDAGFELFADPGTLQLPPTIGALLSARLDRLASDERRVIQHAAVIGERFSWSGLAGLIAEDERTGLGACLQRLVQKELIRPAPTAGGEDEFRFGHILIRDAAYAALPKDARADLHERVARLIESRFAGAIDVDEIGGYHLEQASRAHTELDPFGSRGRELAAEAGARLEAAAQRAGARGDSPAAVSLLERTLALIDADDSRRSGLLVGLGDALRLTGRLEAADQRLGEAEAAATASGDVVAVARAALDRAFLRLYTHPEEGTDAVLAAAQGAADLFESEDDDAAFVHALAIMGEVFWLRCEIGRMQRALERALTVLDAAERPEQVRVMGALARAAMVGPAPVEEGLRLCDDLARQAVDDRILVAMIDVYAGCLEAQLGHFAEARARHARARESFTELGRQLFLGPQSVWAGQVELLAGDATAAEARLRDAYRHAEAAGDQLNLPTAAALLALALNAQGRNDEAEALAEEASRLGNPDEAEVQVLWRIARSRICAAGGAGAEAESLAADAVSIAEETDAVNLRADAQLTLALALSVEDRVEDARAAAHEALACYEAKGNVVGAREVTELLAAPELKPRAGAPGASP
jgi:class 3 adenylate cyclase/tetratricopeptide (TPR) repeat protein